MCNDFLKDLEYLGITARLKRISDTISYDIKELYKSTGLDIEPSWHLVLLKLHQDSSCSMSEMAEAFRLSAPALTKMISKMEKKGYVHIKADEKDSRKKLVKLTEKAVENLPRFEQVWNAGRSSVQELLMDNDHFFSALENLEHAMRKESFGDRAIRHFQSSQLNNKKD